MDAALTRVLWQFCPDGARAHWSHIAGGALFLADLENSCLYRFVLSGGLPQGEPQIFHQPEGSGPRQILTLEGGRLASVNELDGTVRILTEDGGVRAAVQASDVPEPRNWPQSRAEYTVCLAVQWGNTHTCVGNTYGRLAAPRGGFAGNGACAGRMHTRRRGVRIRRRERFAAGGVPPAAGGRIVCAAAVMLLFAGSRFPESYGAMEYSGGRYRKF